MMRRRDAFQSRNHQHQPQDGSYECKLEIRPPRRSIPRLHERLQGIGTKVDLAVELCANMEVMGRILCEK